MSLCLALVEVPVLVALRLFLPDIWTSDVARLDKAGVPTAWHLPHTKLELASGKLDRVLAAGVRFGAVLADAGYGLSAPFLSGLRRHGLVCAVGIPRHQKVYPGEAGLIFRASGRGRPRQRHIRGTLSAPAETVMAAADWRRIS